MVPDNSAEVSFWDTIKDSDDAEMYQAYLQEFPEGKFVSLAKIKLKKLEPAGVPEQSVPKTKMATYIVEVKSKPAGADVYIDDIFEGFTPLIRAFGGRVSIKGRKTRL